VSTVNATVSTADDVTPAGGADCITRDLLCVSITRLMATSSTPSTGSQVGPG
jgi:hypothetical protein